MVATPAFYRHFTRKKLFLEGNTSNTFKNRLNYTQTCKFNVNPTFYRQQTNKKYENCHLYKAYRNYLVPISPNKLMLDILPLFVVVFATVITFINKSEIKPYSPWPC